MSKVFYHYDPFKQIDRCDFLPMCPYWIFTITSRPLLLPLKPIDRFKKNSKRLFCLYKAKKLLSMI